MHFATTALLLLAAGAGGTDGFAVTPIATAAAAAPIAPLDVSAIERAESSSLASVQRLSSSASSNFGVPDRIMLERAATSGVLSSSSSVVAAATAAPSASASTNVASGSGVAITDIQYDGVVPKTEADEYVVLTNQSKVPVDVSKYYIYVATTGTQGPTYYFPKGTPPLKPGASVRVYTNEIHKETGGYSFGSGKAIWSNSGGLAVLKDGNGKKITEYKYKATK